MAVRRRAARSRSGPEQAARWRAYAAYLGGVAGLPGGSIEDWRAGAAEMANGADLSRRSPGEDILRALDAADLGIAYHPYTDSEGAL